MTPKEKANELMSKFVGISLSQVDELVDGIRIRLAKESALIAVDEMIIQNGELYLLGLVKDYYIEKNAYLFNVKSELQSF